MSWGREQREWSASGGGWGGGGGGGSWGGGMKRPGTWNPWTLAYGAIGENNDVECPERECLDLGLLSFFCSTRQVVRHHRELVGRLTRMIRREMPELISEFVYQGQEVTIQARRADAIVEPATFTSGSKYLVLTQVPTALLTRVTNVAGETIDDKLESETGGDSGRSTFDFGRILPGRTVEEFRSSLFDESVQRHAQDLLAQVRSAEVTDRVIRIPFEGSYLPGGVATPDYLIRCVVESIIQIMTLALTDSPLVQSISTRIREHGDLSPPSPLPPSPSPPLPDTQRPVSPSIIDEAKAKQVENYLYPSSSTTRQGISRSYSTSTSNVSTMESSVFGLSCKWWWWIIGGLAALFLLYHLFYQQQGRKRRRRRRATTFISM